MDRRTIEVEEVELVLDAHAVLGEGPVWDDREGVLVWLDIEQGLVHRFDPGTGRNTTIEVGQKVGAVRPRASGGLVLAMADGFAALDTDSGKWEMIADVERDNADNRMNDGGCDSTGRFWAGTMALDEHTGAGALYRLETDHQVTTILSDVTISNGIGWSPDNRTMYYIDTPTQRVDVFEYDAASGAISNRRPFVSVEVANGGPDGLTIDSDGFIWVAVWNGWSVRRYSPAGELDRVVKLPVAYVTACAFGGPDLTDLYITCASRDILPDARSEQAHAGGLFRYRPGVRGLPVYPYRG